MNKDEFFKLSLDDQANYIWEYGTFVVMKKYYNQSIGLYSVGRKYYEVWYRNSVNDIVKITEPDLERVSKFYS